MLDLSGFLDLPDKKYRAAEGLNWSRLKIMGDSPLLFNYSETHPRADTGAFALGRAVHAAVLQPHLYGVGWKVCNAGRDTKAFANFARIYADDYEIITEAEAELVEQMTAAVYRHEEAAMLLALPGINERSAFWQESGRLLKAKIDSLRWQPGAETDPTAPLFTTDLKTTRDLEPEAFARAADNYGYVGQMEHYSTGSEALTGRPVVPIILAVEKEAPFDVGLFCIQPEVRAMGRRLRQSYLDKLARCEAQGRWPGRVPSMVNLGVPRWSKMRAF